MPAPSTLPTWATDTNYTSGPANGTATKVDPGAGKQAQGWVPAEEPGAQNFNWWKNLVGQWITWLSTNGGDKYGERDFGIPGGEFRSPTKAPTGYAFITLALNDVVYYPLQVEAGDTITKCEFYFHTYVTSLGFDWKLQRRQQGTNISDFVDVSTGTNAAIGPTVGVASVQTLTPNHVVVSGYAYRLYVKLSTDASLTGGDVYGAACFRKRV